MRITAKEIEIATEGKIVSGEASAVALRVSTDTRKDCEDALFIPLSGTNFDGHDYIAQAFTKGARIALISRDPSALGTCAPACGCGDSPAWTLIRVADTLAALGKLAAWYRMKFNPLVVCVTGSVGKTTTKEMISLVLSQKYNVLKSQGNFNNEIGLPLTVFGLTEAHTALVLEMGMSNPGEIARLSKIARPDIAVITNIGLAHIERFGTKQNILKAKLEIMEGLSKNGTVFLNGDDTLLHGLMGLIDRQIVYYGIDEGLDVIGSDVLMKGGQGLEFEFQWLGRAFGVELHAAGVHNVHNALAAVAVGLQNDVPPEKIVGALAEFRPVGMRMDIRTFGDVRVINDAYNANPQSMQAALDVLVGLEGEGRRIAVLGDMLELGERAGEYHSEVGAYAAEKRVDLLVAVGVYAADVTSGARSYVPDAAEASPAKAAEGGADRTEDPAEAAERIADGTEGLANVTESLAFADRESAAEYLLKVVRPADIVLIKGSRGMAMERVAELIESGLAAEPVHA
ncbi:MAG: UDP-N-acetylmuramoyl-tripeptide--D-alanyl-D-alanine ligase [Clostridiales bacterium]|jgi:UDP-N-acetylmuramoyl-tripeptide--D-alanyl-D-alanine ligase|nr:UDP-N-acetylmuramoyl-tripeptide--D-alanyl-D-alanine ligase [Clostridiales bacterium]